MTERQKENSGEGFPPTPEDFVGAYLPRPLASYLRLLSVHYGKSLQKTLEHIVRNWRSDHGEEGIVKGLVDKAESEWARRSEYELTDEDDEDEAKEELFSEIAKELKRKKVSKRHRKAVMEKLRDRMKPS